MTPGQTRYVARTLTEGRYERYAIYDRERACWPVLLPALGLTVPQRVDSEADAQAWADEHLNGGVSTLPARPVRRPVTRKRAS